MTNNVLHVKHSPPPSTCIKHAEQQRIAQQTEEFLAAGGEIQHIPSHEATGIVFPWNLSDKAYQGEQAQAY